MDELQSWVQDQQFRKWQETYFPQIKHTTTHYIIHPANATPGNNVSNDQINQRVRPLNSTFQARARVPSIWLRVFAEVIGIYIYILYVYYSVSKMSSIDSFLIVAIRVFCLLLYYTQFNFGEILSPSEETIEQILNDLTNSILLQSAIIDDSLLLEIDLDMSEELVQVHYRRYQISFPYLLSIQNWLSTLSFRFTTLLYETSFIALFGGTIGK